MSATGPPGHKDKCLILKHWVSFHAFTEKHSNVKSNICYILRPFTVWLNAFLYLKNHLKILDFRRGKHSAHGDGARDVTMGKIGRKLLLFYTTSTKTFRKAGETVFLFLFEDKRWPRSDCVSVTHWIFWVSTIWFKGPNILLSRKWREPEF